MLRRFCAITLAMSTMFLNVHALPAKAQSGGFQTGQPMSVDAKRVRITASLPARVRPAEAVRPGPGISVDTAARHFRPWATGFEMDHHRTAPGPTNQRGGMQATRPLTSARVIAQATVTRPAPSAPAATTARTTTVASSNRATSSERRAMSVNNGVASTTGILPWWTYYTGAIPGAGGYEVNVANGNMVFLATDMGVPHKGVPLNMARSYNSQSTHDNLGTDGSIPSNYGNGWTGTYDIRVANNTSGGVSVFTADGARLDYTPDGSGGYVPPPGVHAELQLFQTAVQWTQTDGTAYVFNLPTQPQATAGLAGRLASIFGRNTNSNLVLTYSFDNGDASNAENLNQVVVTAEDGLAITLAFANFNGIRLLATLTWPDGHQVAYAYDNYANLISVTRPGNNIAATLEESHNYLSPATSHQLQTIVDPRQNLNSSDGGWVTMTYNTNAEVSGLNYSGYVNPTISDGTNSGAIQPSEPTGLTVWRSVAINYPSAGNSNVGDTDGHMTQYVFDSLGRITTTESYISSTIYLTAQAGWDSDNQLISTIDARGLETDYANDGYGDITAIASPSTVTTEGTFRPTVYSSYDANHNLIASCDQHWSNLNGMDWTTRPSNSMTLCPSTSGTTRYVYTPTSAEPFGELTSSTTPLGYTSAIAYNPSSQGGSDYGLPTSQTGTAITQNDQSVWTPLQTNSYDSFGNVLSRYDGVGTWTTAYDGMNRPLSTTDPDNVTSYAAYYANGQTQMTSTADQHAAGTGTIVTYDADGNQTSITHHYGNVAGVTSYYYDGPGRLVESVYPHDSTDFFSFSEMKRYLYDLTQGGTVSIGSNSGLKAYGQQFATQEWTPTGTQSGSPTGTVAWNTISGQTYDQLNRTIIQYQLGFSSSAQYTAKYDTSAHNGIPNSSYAGLIYSQTDAFGQVAQYAYDARGMRNSVTYSNLQTSGSTPNETYKADADGRLASSTYSTPATEAWTYDSDGRLVTASGSEVFTYGYYGNGARSTVSVTDNTINKTYTNLLTYNYFANGKLKKLTPGIVSPGSFSWTYTAAGRISTQSDPFTGSTVSASVPYLSSYQLVPESWTYNAYGQPQTLTLPMTGAYSNLIYDLEDELTSATGFYAPGTSNLTPMTVSYGFNVRGENTTGSYTAQGSSSFSTSWPYQALSSANGVMLNTNVAGGAVSPTVAFNPLSGSPTQITNATSGYRTYSYDLLGRLVNNQTSTQSSPSLARTYDGRSRPLSVVYQNFPASGPADCAGNLPTTGTNPTESYIYGPSGHVSQVTEGNSGGGGQPGPPQTLHWDGPNLIYTLQGPVLRQVGFMNDFRVNDLSGNALADINPNTGAIVVWDRDMTGTVVSSHNASGFGGWTAPDPYAQRCEAGPPPSTTTYANTYVNANPFGALKSNGSDGLSTPISAFEGVRAWDTVTSRWTGPNLRGQSQPPSTWHKNNWIAYVDPSGVSAYRNQLGSSMSYPRSMNEAGWSSLGAASPGATSSAVTDPTQLPDAAPGSPGGARRSLMSTDATGGIGVIWPGPGQPVPAILPVAPVVRTGSVTITNPLYGMTPFSMESNLMRGVRNVCTKAPEYFPECVLGIVGGGLAISTIPINITVVGVSVGPSDFLPNFTQVQVPSNTSTSTMTVSGVTCGGDSCDGGCVGQQVSLLRRKGPIIKINLKDPKGPKRLLADQANACPG